MALRCVSESFDETRWEKSCATGSLLSALVPAIVALLVHVDYVSHAKLQFEFAVRWIWHNAAESVYPFSADTKKLLDYN